MHCQILIVFLLITFCNNLPQYYNGGPVWRSNPRSINKNYYANQRFTHNRSPPPYYDYDSDETYPFQYNSKQDDEDFTPPQFWTERSAVMQRIHTSQRSVIEEDSYHVPSSRRNSHEHIARRTPPEHSGSNPNANAEPKKHSTRILNHQRRKAPVTTSEKIQVDDTFYFPGISNAEPTEKTSRPSGSSPFVPDGRNVISKCRKGSTYCVDVDNYPSNYIAEVLRNSANRYEDLIGEDELVNNVSVVIRINLLETPMCKSKEVLEHPKMGQNKDNKWLYIINQDEYVQGIRVELCEKNDNGCALSESFPLGYVTECKQKYIYRKMLALAGDGQPGPDSFRLPSCCSCVYKTGGVSMRSGVLKSSDGALSKRRK